jgi:hypothetical protein
MIIVLLYITFVGIIYFITYHFASLDSLIILYIFLIGPRPEYGKFALNKPTFHNFFANYYCRRRHPDITSNS